MTMGGNGKGMGNAKDTVFFFLMIEGNTVVAKDGDDT